MPSSFSVSVTVERLNTNANQWSDQASRAATVANRIASPVTSGFTSGVRAEFDSWASQWHTTLRGIIDNAGNVRSQLSAALLAYPELDDKSAASDEQEYSDATEAAGFAISQYPDASSGRLIVGDLGQIEITISASDSTPKEIELIYARRTPRPENEVAS